MASLPDRADPDHLRKQAKTLLRQYRAGQPEALARFRAALPAAAHGAPDLRLHDAQSCIAREYGFASWAELQAHVAARATLGEDAAAWRRHWLTCLYAGDIAGGSGTARPHLAARILAERPVLASGDPWLACAIGDLAALRRAVRADPGWVNQPGGPLRLPPLLAVTHSALLRLPAFREALRDCARFLLAAGADPNQCVGNRWPPASLAQPDATMPLSALYGAAGQQRDAVLTRLLLEAGADPNDGESLYHALENPDCTRLLLAHGARIAGTNAIYRALDLPDATAIALLLEAGGDANERAGNAPLSEWGSPLLWAIRRRRSPRHIAALLKAGADPRATNPAGLGAYRLARQFGLREVAGLLAAQGLAEPLPAEEEFLAACAEGDAAKARAIGRPDLPAALAPRQLRLLPEMAQDGALPAVRAMLELGWPVAVPGGDWQASALNLAVFRGDAAMTRLLLDHGAHWTERHGFGDDVRGTLSWASCNRPVEEGDWEGCARALLAHGMPPAQPAPGQPGLLLLEGLAKPFPEEVAEILLGPVADSSGAPR